MPVTLSRSDDPPLLRTKFSVPPIPPEFIPRPRLTERIDRGVMGLLTLIVAPAGFGKTNLLIEWAKESNLPVAWLNIDSDDNDPYRFFGYLVGAMQTLEPGLGEEALDIIQSTKGGGVEVGITLLINEISAISKEMVLVLDDFHALEDPVILQRSSFYLKHLPHNFHLVIASRSEPELDLMSLRAKGKVVELGANDLRFTREEVALYIDKAMGLQLSSEAVKALEKRTDGWITGLQLTVLSLGHHQSDLLDLLANPQGEAHYLIDFLAEEVLDRQSEDIRQFLLRSSVLDELNSSLCEAVVNPEAQPGYGTVMLNRLEHAHLFITALDEKHEWFRYHPLFVDFLRHIHAEINPEEIPVLQKRAALWFEKNADLDEAFEYALASSDLEWTADLIQRNLQTMIQTGEIFPLTRWIGKLPDEIIHQRPGLSLAYAWGLIAAYQLDLAQYWIDDVQQSLISQIEKETGIIPYTDEPGATQALEDIDIWNVHGGLAICQSTLAILSGDLDKAAEYSREATSFLKEDNPFVHSLLALDDSLYYILSGDTQKAISSLRDTINIARRANNLLVLIIATCQLAEMQALQGHLSQACATLQKARLMAVGPDEKPLPLAGLIDIEFGEILLERDALEEAGTYLDRGCQATQTIWPISSLDGLISLARLRQTLGDTSGSQTIIAETLQTALGTESSQWDDSIISAVAVRLALQRGDLANADLWWKKGDFPDITGTISLENYPYHILEYLLITQARFLLETGLDTGGTKVFQQALELLGELLLEAKRFHRLTSQIEILVLQAMVQLALEDEQAINSLLQALALGEPEGYRRIYLDDGQRLYELLLKCQCVQQASSSYLPSPAFIESLLEAIQLASSTLPHTQRTLGQRTDATTAKTDDGLPISLSAREMEVLTLIAEGKSNQEISAELCLALNTVKRHAYNIYAKLGVRKRTQAVLKARQLGLIP